MADSMILIGASVRAAAQSAVRAGFTPWCADGFADRDLQAIAESRRVRHYPAGFVAALADAPADPLIYTGALENYPRLVDALTLKRPLWGNNGEILGDVRSPVRVAEALLRNGLRTPQVSLVPATIPRDGSWLCKPLRSAGGRRIRAWSGPVEQPASRVKSEGRRARRRGGYYFQERVDGISCAGLYVAAGGSAVLLGVTRQLVGTSWTSASPFSYAGSLGPLSLTPDQDAAFRQIGDCLAAEFRLTGLFGVDAMVNDEGVWPVEVNPRYPASAEVLERAGRYSAVRLHAEACRSGGLPPLPEYGRRMAGKAIAFAAAEVEATEALVDWAEGENQGRPWPAVADLPHPGSRIPQGGPVLTVLCEGTELPEAEAQLRRQIAAAIDVAGVSGVFSR